MTIGKRISEALDKFHANDAEGALIPVSMAIDATATKFYGKQGRGSYKDFINENMLLISKAGLNGRQIENISLQVPPEFVTKWPQMKVGPDRLCRLDEILYHVVRCGLLHECELASALVFQPEVKIEIKDGKIRLPSKLIVGFVVAIVACPANKDESLPDRYGINLSGYDIPFSALWGKKEQLWNLYQAMDEIWKGWKPTPETNPAQGES
jgi:hypothetical protein